MVNVHGRTSVIFSDTAIGQMRPKNEAKMHRNTARMDTCVLPHSTRVRECVWESGWCNLTSGRWAISGRALVTTHWNSPQSINQLPMQIWFEPGKDRSVDYTSTHAALKVLEQDSFSECFQDTGDFMWQIFLPFCHYWFQNVLKVSVFTLYMIKY